MLKGLNLHPHNVPSSNVVFVRSSGEVDIKTQFNKLAEDCWPFHLKVIESLKVDVVLCFGQIAGKWACKKLHAFKQIDNFVENNNRRWRSTAFTSEDGIRVIVATHPSRADWTSPESDPTPIVKRVLTRES